MKPNILIFVSFAAVVLYSASRAEAQAPVAPLPAATPEAKPALKKTELRKLIENTEWAGTGNEDSRYYFHRDGKLMGVWGKFYTVEAPNILKIYSENPDANRKAEFALFRIDMATMVAEFDRGASSHGGKPLKYIGPIAKKK